MENAAGRARIMRDRSAEWIWAPADLLREEPGRNAFVRFRKVFDRPEGRPVLHITADSRYVLYVNGERLGSGPPRGWPHRKTYDSYEITPYLYPGRNVIAVLVQHYGEGTFQYIPGPAGLLVQVDSDSKTVLASDDSWRVDLAKGYARVVPRISVQLGFEEQYDAREADGWTGLPYDDASWERAVIVDATGAESAAASARADSALVPRDIPFLTEEPVCPTRVISVERVQSASHIWTIYMKPYVAPGDLSSNMVCSHAYLWTQVYAPEAVIARICWPHRQAQIKVNGTAPKVEPDTGRGEGEGGGKLRVESGRIQKVAFRPGWNSLLIDARGTHHLQELTLVVESPVPLRLQSRGEEGGSPWTVAGPFALTSELEDEVGRNCDDSLVVCEPLSPAAGADLGEALWASGRPGDDPRLHACLQEVGSEHLPEVNVFAQSYTDRILEESRPDSDPCIEESQALLSPNHEWTTVHPDPKGRDIRLLLDFGREINGFHRFEVDAPEGTILDWHGFEFIQRDGRYNFTEGLNNAFRYVCRAGRQSYRSKDRRGFRYCYLTLRNMSGPVRIRSIEVLFSSYPQANRGDFSCSDALLDRIWSVGAHTLRCCAEDTYTDCPTYEQVHWVGDARNEALIDWTVNGDPRLWRHCLVQAGESLRRSPLVESHVPSAWRNILPAWSFLWMRSCREYALYTGDMQGARSLLDYLARNIEGIKSCLNDKGLLEIRAWNMFDWAAMDTPNHGVVTHQNCLAVWGLSAAAELASWLGEPGLASSWQRRADELSTAVNRHLWNEEMRAYTDCLRGEEHSRIYSQQTQTAAYISGVADGKRGARCREILYRPPEGFVKAGSPFFEFFLLEAMRQEGLDREFIETIRRDWGFMIEEGATTFWEMWSLKGGRLTRSHCHGWSGAPTFFLSSYVLGVTPRTPGFAKTEVAPHPGDLTWCDGTVPTPLGDIRVRWENREGAPFRLDVQAPKAIELKVVPPRPGSEVSITHTPAG